MVETNFSSYGGIGDIGDDTLVDEVFSEDTDIIDMLYDSGNFNDELVDFGGGVYGVTCRSVLAKSNSDPDKLRQLLGLRKTSANSQLCASIIKMCEEELRKGAYLI